MAREARVASGAGGGVRDAEATDRFFPYREKIKKVITSRETTRSRTHGSQSAPEPIPSATIRVSG